MLASTHARSTLWKLASTKLAVNEKRMAPLSSHALTGRWFLTIQQAARMLDSGCINASQLSSFCHSMAVAGENIWGLNAFSRLVDKNTLMERAKESDDRREMGEPLSILDGIPVSIKSNIAEKFSPLTAGSKILGHCENHPPPCGYDADTVRILLREKGAIYMGATSMDEFGMGSLGTNVPKGVCPAKNPLPLKKQLHRLWDEEFGEEKDDETMAEIIHLSPQKITEVHQQALESLKEEETDHYSAGGSSSGSAVSVAHGSSLLSLGTDTGGSVRLPAAWCGLVGLKPSYGLLSRHGVVSYASSFDTVGILSNSVGCAATALDAMAQRDIDYSRDSTFSAYNSEEHDLAEVGVAQTLVMDKPLSGIKVGIPSAFSVEECPKDILEAWSKTAERLEDKGAQIVQISTEQITPKLVQTALSAYYILVSAEASSNLSRYDGFRYGVAAQGVLENPPQDDLTPLEQQYSASRAQGFGPEVIKRILCGAFVLSSDNFHTHYEGAAKLRAALAEELSSVLKNDADLLLFPTVLSSAPKLTENLLNPTAIFANDVMTVPASLAGLPAVSVPVPGENKEFLAGMQLVSSRLQEATLLRAASVIQ